MVKASEVYNKLKLQFVGKSEVLGKPKTEQQDNGKDLETTGDCSVKKSPPTDAVTLLELALAFDLVWFFPPRQTRHL